MLTLRPLPFTKIIHEITQKPFMFHDKLTKTSYNLLPFHQLQQDFPQTQQFSFCDFSLVCVLTPTERKENSIKDELNLYLL